METKTVTVPFTVEYESHPLAEFQDGGHFIPGMQDEEQRRRPWVGDAVHVLVLKHLGETVLRVIADSAKESERLMSANIKGTMLAFWAAQQSAQFSYDQMKRLVDRQAQFQAWIDTRYKDQIAAGEHTKFADLYDVAMHYMGKVGQ